MLAHPAQKSAGVGWPKIAERRAGKKRGARGSGNIGGNVEIAREVSDDRPDRQLRKPIPNALYRLREKVRRYIDRRVHPRRMERADEDFGLDGRAGAVFQQHDPFATESGHLLGVSPKNPGLGPGQIIFIETRDFLEQLRTALVVEPTAG